MAGSSVYPGALDNYSNNSPTNLGDNDSTGRTHSERHDDVEASVEAVQSELGLNPSGAFATVRARLDDLDEGFGNTSSVTSTTPALGSKVFTVDKIGSYVVGSYVVISSLADPLNIFMVGKISAISGLNITVLVESAQGAAAADWVFSLTGPQPTIAQIINVNTTTPALRVTQTGSGPALLVEDSANPDATPFVVDAAGRVGIGTTSPVTSLNLYDGTLPVINLNNSSSGTTATDGLTLTLFGSDAYFNNREAGSMLFYTSATERMRITSAGNVGIGTSSPSAPLHVRTSTDTSGIFQEHSGDTGTARFTTFRSRSAGAAVVNNDVIARFQGATFTGGSSFPTPAIIEMAMDGTVSSTSGPSRLAFYTTTDGGLAASEKMRLNNAGLITGSGTSLGAWTSWTPTVTAGTGTFTTVAGTGRYCRIGKIIHLVGRVTITTNGTAATDVRYTLPVAAVNVIQVYMGAGRESAVTGNCLSPRIDGNASLINITRYDNAYPGGTGYLLDFSITYEVA